MKMKKLQEAVARINAQGGVAVSGRLDDGRINSLDDEATLIADLIEIYGEEDIVEPRAREWFDVRMFGEPVQIKSTKLQGSDNFSSKPALLYAFTDMTEDEITDLGNGWASFEVALATNRTEVDRDYFIIVIDKNTGMIHLTSLKRLRVLTPNGNNLLFQIPWKKNLEPLDKTFDEAWDLVVGTYKKSVIKKISVHSNIDML